MNTASQLEHEPANEPHVSLASVEAMTTPQPSITVEVRDVYGKPTVYPMDAAARTFADIAGTTTLTDMTLKRIKALGYHINVTQRKIEI